ncbi:class I SAM-dependent methyltransferase [Psychroflexus sp. MBR-150]|jgi:SAM-dependent methyltransferase
MNTVFKFLLNLFPRTFLIKISFCFKPILKYIYKGSKYQDPIDGSTFRKFLSYGYQKQRPNVLSPSTLSLERHRLLWLFLKHETDLFSKPQKLLHFAPEQAFYKRFKSLNNLDYTTTDLNSPLADVRADICNLPFDDESFDVVLCNHVLEHIKDDTKAMTEIYRILKKGGWAILQIPQDLNREKTFEDNSITDPKERSKIFGQYDHVRIYGLDYFDKLKSIGFEVHPIEYTNSFSEQDKDYYRLAQREIIPYVIKPKT